MRKDILNRGLLFTFVIISMAACRPKKAIVVAPPVLKSDTVNVKKKENLQMLRDKDLVFKTLSMKGKAQISINGNSNSASVNVRMLKDKKIWVSVTAFAGIEVARALITPDSVLMMNRVDNIYLSKPFSYIHSFTNKQVNFKMLQDVFTGNAIGSFMEEDADLDLQNGVWLLKGERKSLAYQILFNTLLKSSETNLNDVQSGQALKVVYGEYQQVGDYLFPSNIQINSQAGLKKAAIELAFSKIESNVELDFPFTVPKRFKVIN
ncbi:DUF4292 domain-containing protein [Pedobacter nutrimenti]|uniref:DUF4292 domain-containing protein n=1 Tax=Pedobacter nutrimenti TaxID=1241337 RepID=UPI00292CEA8D|nr:DUF4292 domain-containing protein [Pedobacter nutrimenti]